MTRDDVTNAAESWRPVWTGEEAERAWQVIAEIAAALEDLPPTVDRDPFLGGGTAGLALFFAYLAEATTEDHHADVAMSYVERMVDGMAASALGPGLYSGFSGPAWTLEHLNGRWLELEGEDGESHREIDDTLLALLRQESWRAEYDLISGLAGFGVYGCEALPRAQGRACLELLLDQLERLAVARPEGVTWFTPPEHLPEGQRRHYPQGYYNLGIAHGVPAVVAILGQMSAHESLAERSRELLEPAVSWLLSQQLDADSASCFPTFTAGDVEPQPARLAWCYGDPGVAVALLAAARAVGRTDWEREAVRISRRAAARGRDGSGVRDAGLCHGAAGLGHIFNRLHQATGDATIAAAARFWLDQALAMQRPGEGIAGYSAWWTPSDEVEPEWTPIAGFLMGAAGIGLALLAAVTPIEPQWDRLLMTSIPPTVGAAGG